MDRDLQVKQLKLLREQKARDLPALITARMNEIVDRALAHLAKNPLGVYQDWGYSYDADADANDQARTKAVEELTKLGLQASMVDNKDGRTGQHLECSVPA